MLLLLKITPSDMGLAKIDVMKVDAIGLPVKILNHS